jgi:sugar phosphate isomerase/epimerase
MKRKHFLKSSLSLMVSPFLADFFYYKKSKAKLSFSTLGCPKWSLDQIVEAARHHGYKAIEMRGLQGQIDITKSPDFANDVAINNSLAKVFAAGLEVINLGSSANLHYADAALRQENLNHAKAYIDLAQKLRCPFVRVFPNDLPPQQSQEQTVRLIATALQELASYSKPRNVRVLLETHGKVVHKDLLLEIMQKTNNKNVGLIWDVWNMWSITKEPPAQVHAALKKYIRHTHIKDGNMVNNNPEYVLIGNGQAPLGEAIKALEAGNYKGYYSFEWEKMWHPEIAEPEVAIPHFAQNFEKLYF